MSNSSGTVTSFLHFESVNNTRYETNTLRKDCYTKIAHNQQTLIAAKICNRDKRNTAIYYLSRHLNVFLERLPKLHVALERSNDKRHRKMDRFKKSSEYSKCHPAVAAQPLRFIISCIGTLIATTCRHVQS